VKPSRCVSASGDELELKELDCLVTGSDEGASSSAETRGQVLPSVWDVSRAGDTCCGFSSIVPTGLLAGRWLLTIAM